MHKNIIAGIGGLTLAVGLMAGLAACSSDPKSDNALYNKLAGIMDDQNRQWDAGKKARDVSYLVCRGLKEGELMEMSAEKSLSGAVEFKHYERSMAFPDNTRIWSITRPVSLMEKQVLMIEMSPKNGCYAVYRHTS